MYNDIILIFLCVFAVYGVYSLVREFWMLICRKNKIAAAIRIDSQMRENDINDAILFAENYISSYSFLERMPIIICDGENAKYLKRYGYDIYIRQTEEK